MEIIGVVHNNTIVFDKLNFPEGKRVKVIIEEKKERRIDKELLELVGIIKNEKVENLKEYMTEKLRVDYENIRWYKYILRRFS